jgi:hypothetical protein
MSQHTVLHCVSAPHQAIIAEGSGRQYMRRGCQVVHGARTLDKVLDMALGSQSQSAL